MTAPNAGTPRGRGLRRLIARAQRPPVVPGPSAAARQPPSPQRLEMSPPDAPTPPTGFSTPATAPQPRQTATSRPDDEPTTPPRTPDRPSANRPTLAPQPRTEPPQPSAPPSPPPPLTATGQPRAHTDPQPSGHRQSLADETHPRRSLPPAQTLPDARLASPTTPPATMVTERGTRESIAPPVPPPPPHTARPDTDSAPTPHGDDASLLPAAAAPATAPSPAAPEPVPPVSIGQIHVHVTAPAEPAADPMALLAPYAHGLTARREALL